MPVSTDLASSPATPLRAAYLSGLVSAATGAVVFPPRRLWPSFGAGNAAQAGMIGPVSTLFLAWWLLAEPITGLQLAGTTLVMTGIVLLSMRRLPTPSVAEVA